MRIFMTGSTTLQTNMQKVEHIQKLNVPRHIVRLMQEQGHTVTWSDHPVPNELPPCDLVWINIGPPNSINSRYSISATWAIWQAVTEHRPLVLFFDDWQFKQVFSGYRTFEKAGQRQLTKQISGRYLYFGDVTQMVHWSDELMATAHMIETGEIFQHAVAAIPKYRGWGDASIVTKAMPGTPLVYPIDPTPFTRDDTKKATPSRTKKRSWLLASIVPHNQWVDKLLLDWPVEYIGARKLGAPRLKTEADVAEQYALHWGILSPTYPHAGSGWFRTRYIYSALSESVLYCGAADAKALGIWYAYNPHEIEAMSDAELRKVAYNQQFTLMNRLDFDEQRTAAEIATTLAAATEKVHAHAQLV